MTEVCKVQTSISHVKAERIISTNCKQILEQASNNIEPKKDNNEETDTTQVLGDIAHRITSTFVSQITETEGF